MQASPVAPRTETLWNDNDFSKTGFGAYRIAYSPSISRRRKGVERAMAKALR